MASEVLKVTGTKGGANVTSTISDINPEATNAQLAQLGTKFNALTTNLYKESNRITTVNVDTEPGGGTKPTPTLTLSQTSIAASQFTTGTPTTLCTVTTNSDGNLYVRQTAPLYLTQANQTIIGTTVTGASVQAQTVYIGVTETDSFKGFEVAFEITA